jgi:HSP20 family protein
MLIWRRPPLLSGLFDDNDSDLDLDWRPDLDVFELADEFLLSVSLPGVHARDVEVTVVGRTMSISGVRHGAAPAGAIPHLIESSRGRFGRRVRLPAEARLSGIRTQMAQGQLVVRVPKLSPRAMRLAVRTGRR